MSLPSGQAPVPNDLDLITRIKTDNDSAAVTELVHRHTGSYISVIQQYENFSDFRARANIPDLKEDKFINIYQWALKYDPNRPTETGKPMQFSSYVWDMTRYMCRTIISRGTENVELTEINSPSSEVSVTDTAEKDSALETVRDEVNATDDPLFRRMFKLRHGGKKVMSWRKVAEKVGMTHEGARKAFNKHMRSIKEHARD